MTGATPFFDRRDSAATDRRTYPGVPPAGAREQRVMDRGFGGRVASIEAQLAKGSERMKAIEMALVENTAVTQDVLEIITTAKGFFKVLGYVGEAAKWLVGIAAGVGTLWSVWPHGTPPK